MIINLLGSTIILSAASIAMGAIISLLKRKGYEIPPILKILDLIVEIGIVVLGGLSAIPKNSTKLGPITIN